MRIGTKIVTLIICIMTLIATISFGMYASTSGMFSTSSNIMYKPGGGSGEIIPPEDLEPEVPDQTDTPRFGIAKTKIAVNEIVNGKPIVIEYEHLFTVEIFYGTNNNVVSSSIIEVLNAKKYNKTMAYDKGQDTYSFTYYEGTSELFGLDSINPHTEDPQIIYIPAMIKLGEKTYPIKKLENNSLGLTNTQTLIFAEEVEKLGSNLFKHPIEYMNTTANLRRMVMLQDPNKMSIEATTFPESYQEYKVYAPNVNIQKFYHLIFKIEGCPWSNYEYFFNKTDFFAVDWFSQNAPTCQNDVCFKMNHAYNPCNRIVGMSDHNNDLKDLIESNLIPAKYIA